MQKIKFTTKQKRMIEKANDDFVRDFNQKMEEIEMLCNVSITNITNNTDWKKS
jgi:hypothetical protein